MSINANIVANSDSVGVNLSENIFLNEDPILKGAKIVGKFRGRCSGNSRHKKACDLVFRTTSRTKERLVDP